MEIKLGEVQYKAVSPGALFSARSVPSGGSQDVALKQVPIDILGSFVPNCLVDKLLQSLRAEEFTEPWSEFFDGVCLIADISGFTRLSGNFCSQGDRGIDGLQQLINGYLGQLVAIVYSFGGDVIKFAGDALICLFRPKSAEHLDSLEACRMAILCSWMLKDQCTEELTLRVAVGFGEIAVAILGGHENKWDILQSSDHIEDLSDCLKGGGPKSVVVTSIIFDRLLELMTLTNDDFIIEGEPCPPARVVITSVSSTSEPTPTVVNNSPRKFNTSNEKEEAELISLLQPFVPQNVTQALHSGVFNFIAELREVTTVFIKWEGYQWNKHRNLLSLQPMFRAAQELISTSGGFLRQFLVDDKGCVLIAVWGVPAATFPDNCLRALWMTASLHDRFATLPVPMHVSCGITTGTAYCGNIGASARMEYSCLGTVVNMSARLMAKADKGILLDEETYFRLPELMRDKLEAVDGVSIKGFDKELTVYQFIDFPVNFDFKDLMFGLNSVPIRKACKGAFVSLLRNLTRQLIDEQQNSKFAPGTATDIQNCGCLNVTKLFPSQRANRESTYESGFENSKTFKLAGPRAGAVDQDSIRCKIVIVEGAVGMGKERAVTWLKSASSQINVRLASVNMHKSDASVEFAALHKLIRQLAGDSVWDSIERQASFIRNLLFELYPNDKDSRQKIGLPTFLSCFHANPTVANIDLRVSPTTATSVNSQSFRLVGQNFAVSYRHQENADGPASARKVQMPPLVYRLHCAFEICQHIFMKQPTLLILENIQHMDEKSWKVILQFPTSACKLSIAMTKLMASQSDGSTGRVSGARKSSVGSSLRDRELMLSPRFLGGGSTWLEQGIIDLMSYPHSTRVVLTQHSTEEIATSLAYSLGTIPTALPKGLVTAVQKLSGSSPIWVSEICEFIRTTGVEEFMTSMAIKEEDENRSSGIFSGKLDTTFAGVVGRQNPSSPGFGLQKQRSGKLNVDSTAPVLSKQSSGRLLGLDASTKPKPAFDISDLDESNAIDDKPATLVKQGSFRQTATSLLSSRGKLGNESESNNSDEGPDKPPPLMSRQNSFKASLLMSSPSFRGKIMSDAGKEGVSDDSNASSKPGRLPPMTSADSVPKLKIGNDDGRSKRAVGGGQYQSQINLQQDAKPRPPSLKLDLTATERSSSSARGDASDVREFGVHSGRMDDEALGGEPVGTFGVGRLMRNTLSVEYELMVHDKATTAVPTLELSNPVGMKASYVSDKGDAIEKSGNAESPNKEMKQEASPVAPSSGRLSALSTVPGAVSATSGHRRDSKDGLNVGFVLPTNDRRSSFGSSQLPLHLQAGASGGPSRSSFSNHNSNYGSPTRSSFSLQRDGNENKKIVSLSNSKLSYDSPTKSTSSSQFTRTTPRSSQKDGKSAASKLSFLVLCRFAKLSTEAQSIARTASIVGFEFTQSQLLNALPSTLLVDVCVILASLVAANWLAPPVAVQTRDGELYDQYSFTHPMVHRTIYELTPPSVRDAVHLQLAQYMENSKEEIISKEEKLQFIAYHYVKCDSKKEKSFEFLTRLSLETLAKYHQLTDFEGCLAFAEYAGEFAETTADVHALMGLLALAVDKYNQEKKANRKKERSRFRLGMRRRSTVGSGSIFPSGEAGRFVDVDQNSFLSKVQVYYAQLVEVERLISAEGAESDYSALSVSRQMGTISASTNTAALAAPVLGSALSAKGKRVANRSSNIDVLALSFDENWRHILLDKWRNMPDMSNLNHMSDESQSQSNTMSGLTTSICTLS